MEGINLVGLFVSDHNRIVALPNEFKRSRRNKTAKTIFEQLDYSLKLHFKEEEHLYSKYKQKTGEFLGSLQAIRKEHETIIGYLDAIRKALNNSSKINTKEFFPLLDIDDFYNIDVRDLAKESLSLRRKGYGKKKDNKD